GRAVLLVPARGARVQILGSRTAVLELALEQVREQAVVAIPALLCVDRSDQQVLLREPVEPVARVRSTGDRVGQRPGYLAHDRRPGQELAVVRIDAGQDLGLEV